MNISGILIGLAVLGGLAISAGAEIPVSTGTVALSTSAVVEPFVWPVSRQIQGKAVTVVSKFGTRHSPAEAKPEVHEGIDFAVPVGASVRASKSGKVLFAGFSKSYVQRADKKQQNRLIIVRHSDGMSTRYVHLGRLKVRPPQEVQAGDVLGVTDASDEWTTAVLHFEIRDAVGKALNPQTLLTVGP